MKKWNVSLAAGVVLACLLAGCGKNDTTTQETTAAATTEAVTTEQATEADAQIATGSDLASASDVVEDWMVPIPAEMSQMVNMTSRLIQVLRCSTLLPASSR